MTMTTRESDAVLQERKEKFKEGISADGRTGKRAKESGVLRKKKRTAKLMQQRKRGGMEDSSETSIKSRIRNLPTYMENIMSQDLKVVLAGLDGLLVLICCGKHQVFSKHASDKHIAKLVEIAGNEKKVAQQHKLKALDLMCNLVLNDGMLRRLWETNIHSIACKLLLGKKTPLPVRTSAIWIIGNTIGSPVRENRAKLVGMGAPAALVSNLQGILKLNPLPDNLVPLRLDLFWALHNCFIEVEESELASLNRCGASKLMAQATMNSNDPGILELAVSSLAFASYQSVVKRQFLQNKDLLDRACWVVVHGHTVLTQQEAMRLLSNLSSFPERPNDVKFSTTGVLLSAGILDTIRDVFKNQGGSIIKTDAAFLVSNLCHGSADQLKQILTSDGLVDNILDFALNAQRRLSHECTRCTAAIIGACLGKLGTTDRLKAVNTLLGKKALEIIAKGINAPDPAVQSDALQCCGELLKAVDKEFIMAKFEEEGILDAVLELSMSGVRNQVVTLAEDLSDKLEEYSEAEEMHLDEDDLMMSQGGGFNGGLGWDNGSEWGYGGFGDDDNNNNNNASFDLTSSAANW